MTSEDELFAEFGADAGMFYSALVRSTDYSSWKEDWCRDSFPYGGI